jgi:hypothetical protein
MLGICKGVYIHSRPTASPSAQHVFNMCVQCIANTTAPTCVQTTTPPTLISICICVICLYVCTQMSKSWAPYFDVIDTYYHYYYIIYFDVIDTYYHYLILKHTLSYIIVFTHARSIICNCYNILFYTSFILSYTTLRYI